MGMRRDDLVDIINLICELELKNVDKPYTRIDGDDQLLSESGIDSFSYMMVFMWIGDSFDIPDDSFTLDDTMQGDVKMIDMVNFIENNLRKNTNFITFKKDFMKRI